MLGFKKKNIGFVIRKTIYKKLSAEEKNGEGRFGCLCIKSIRSAKKTSIGSIKRGGNLVLGRVCGFGGYYVTACYKKMYAEKLDYVILKIA